MGYKKLSIQPLVFWWYGYRRSKIHLSGKKGKTVCGRSWPACDSIHVKKLSSFLKCDCKICLKIGR